MTGLDRCGYYADAGRELTTSIPGRRLKPQSGWLKVGHENHLNGAYDWQGRNRVLDAIVDESVDRIATTSGERDDRITAHCRERLGSFGVDVGRLLMRTFLESQIGYDEHGSLVHGHVWLTRTNREGRVEIVDFSARHYPVYAARIGQSWHGEAPPYLWEWEDELPSWVSFIPK